MHYLYVKELEEIKEKWGKKYPYAISNWESNWDVVSPFFQFNDNIRHIMYTINIIEGVNRQFRKVTKTKSVLSKRYISLENAVPGICQCHEKMENALQKLGSGFKPAQSAL